MEQKGKDHLISGGELKLAVPQSLHKAEAKKEAKKQRKFKEPKGADFDLTLLPETERNEVFHLS